MNDSQVAVIAIGALVTITGGFFAQAKAQNKTHNRIAYGLEKLAKTHEKGNVISKNGFDQAETRNGHLGDLIVQQGKANKTLADIATKEIVKAVQTVKSQHVNHQVVDEATIDKEVIKEKKV